MSLKIGAAIILATRDEAKFVYLAGNVHCNPGHRRRRSGVAGADAEGKSGRL